MPKINFNQQGQGLDLESAGEKINIDGLEEKSLFSSLMDNIIGDDGESLKEGASVDVTRLDGDTEIAISNKKINHSLAHQLESLDEKTLEKISKIDLSSIKNSELNEQVSIKLGELSKAPEQSNTKLNNFNPYAHLKSENSFMQAANGIKLVSPEIDKGQGLKESNSQPQKMLSNSNLLKGIKTYDSLAPSDSVMFSSVGEQSIDIQKDIQNVQARSNNIGTEVNMTSFADSSSQKIENNLLSKVNTNSIDLSSLGVAGGNESEVINEIVNHLDKMKLTGAKELNVIVKHNELGKFQINASDVRGAGDSRLNLEILSNSKEVQSFFKANESGLVTLLTDRGFNLSGIKVGASNNEGFAKDFQFSSDEKGFSGQQQSRRDGQNQDSQRRANLWKEYQEKMGA